MTPGDTQYSEADFLIICFHRLPLLSQLKYLHDLSANCKATIFSNQYLNREFMLQLTSLTKLKSINHCFIETL